MGETGLTSERILEAALEVVRRFGPEKATVVDVARALGVTHASVYRYFSSKAALRDAVVRRWLEVMMPPLEAVAAGRGPAGKRLKRWLDLLIAGKRKRAAEDPELFAAYYTLAVSSREVVRSHVEALVCQAAKIIGDGVADGVFEVDDARAAARAVLYATSCYHNPAHAAEWCDPAIDDRLEEVWHLLLRGLVKGSAAGRKTRKASINTQRD
jgi:AcrR family transcriptional regulator